MSWFDSLEEWKVLTNVLGSQGRETCYGIRCSTMRTDPTRERIDVLRRIVGDNVELTKPQLCPAGSPLFIQTAQQAVFFYVKIRPHRNFGGALLSSELRLVHHLIFLPL